MASEFLFVKQPIIDHLIALVTMKITVPEGKKAQIVDAVCKFIGFKDEGLIESGSVVTVFVQLRC